MSDPQLNFVWYELMTTDAAAAERFYCDVVGWGAKPQPRPMAYTLLTVGDVQVAGLMKIPPEAAQHGMRPHWIGYIGVPDVEAACEKLTSLGGKVHRPADDIPGVGRFAMVADPQGAGFVLFSGLPGMQAPPALEKAGYTGWRELLTSDLDGAVAFYSALCGWIKDRSFGMGAMGNYEIFTVGGKDNGGMMTKPPSVPMPFWVFYFQVDAMGAAIERLKSAGGTVINGPHEVPGGSIVVQALDPQGAMFALVSTNP